MPEIGDVMDVIIDDLSPEQLQQLKDATDQFQMKCLMSFDKNRSGVPYLKSEMPRVLLSGESDATSFQEKEEALQVFRDTAEAVLGRHHTALLGMFKQMMIGVFGPGMEKCLVGYPLTHILQRSEKPVLSTNRSSTATAEPAHLASSTKRWEPADPAPSIQRWESANATSSTRRGGSASPATSTRQ
jgi:hypothetical protein